MNNTWWKSGEPWIWLTASAVTVSIVIVVGLLTLIAARGMGHFWASAVFEGQYTQDGQTTRLIGEIRDQVQIPASRLHDMGVKTDEKWVTRYLIKTGNRELVGLDFRWILANDLKNVSYPKELLTIERYEWGNFYGYLQAVKHDGEVISSGEAAWQEAQQRLAHALQIHAQIQTIEKNEMGRINYALDRLRLAERRLELNHDKDPEKLAKIAEQRVEYQQQFDTLRKQLTQLYQEIKRDSLMVKAMDDQEIEIDLAKIVRVYRSNTMNVIEKLQFYFIKLWEFVSDDPREANTEGGIFPAIFGTVLMVFIMSIFVTPFGVIAAVYLHEYAKQGFLTRTIRIAVNNLAGVPSIVYGVFGLGFFVYFVGSNIDLWFFPEALPSPTFGTGGILWASLTLAILTVPVVIVATEEGLSRIPSSIREGSLALGATKAETLWRTVLPMASPAIMTGLILAIARAAGEVAPLMLVGVVKLAPSLVLDMNYPFLHMERKFMHLGFHIYDVGFQSPNVEAARPLVYATAFLLVAVIVILNLSAIWIRNHLREKYKALETT
jgi:phosphate transport system permease protein